MISYEFLDSRGFTISAGKPLPLQAVAAARLRLDGDARQPDYWGQANVDLMKQYRRRVIVLVTFGLTPPGGVLETDANGRLTLRLDPTHALRRYHDDTEAVLHDILRRNGCRAVRAQFINQSGAAREELFFSTAHQVGSCRMATRKADGVVDAAGQVFDHPGLYISDGSAIPSSLAVNTSLTILANAERVAAGIVARYGLRSPEFS
jgi:enediyne biosynthesis protein E9